MTITERQCNGIAVLDVRGAIAGREAAAAVVTAVRSQARAGRRAVVANLGAVPSIDLGGLGALLEAAGAMRAVDGAFSLTGVTRRIHDLIVITRLLTAFQTFDTVDEAIGGVTTGSAPSAALPSPAALGAVTRFLRRA